MSAPFDVAIVGGGPAGATAGALLRKYMPSFSVLILEKEKFPRDHVGESQLPLISTILDEMKVWDKVEAAGFPIKIGATYTWGRDPEPWHFNFIPPERFAIAERPAKFEGQRRYTAFQVDRAIYDDILLRHAGSLGCTVRQVTHVAEFQHEGDRVTGVRLTTGETIDARYYIDASGTVGLLRRTLEIPIDAPDTLRNIAFWDYWENAEWAETIGIGGTRVQVRSLPYGWIWFIPLGPTRTSIGLICHAEHYKKTGKSPEQIYKQALHDETFIAALIAKATPEGQVRSTKDWSFVADRLCGENWFLAGEAAGFADPILAAGLTLAHTSARDAAYTIMELERAEHERDWLLKRFNDRNRESIYHHIRFAIYWYSANGLQSDLQEYCQELAASAGLRLNPRDAFQWISQGAFTTEIVGNPSISFYDLTSIHDLVNRFGEGTRKQNWLIDGYSVFELNLHNATQSFMGDLAKGRIHKIPCYVKGNRKLPLHEFYGMVVDVLRQTSDASTILDLTSNSIEMIFPSAHWEFARSRVLEVLESLVLDGWVIPKHNRKRPALRLSPEAATIVSGS